MSLLAALVRAYDRLPDAPPLVRMRAPLDADAWPLATAGFFKFRKHIPALLARLSYLRMSQNFHQVCTRL